MHTQVQVQKLQLEQVGLDVHTAQTGNHAAELDKGADALEDAHVGPADLLWDVSNLYSPPLFVSS